MKKVSKLVGRSYGRSTTWAPPTRTRSSSPGSSCETIEETVNLLNKQGAKLG